MKITSWVLLVIGGLLTVASLAGVSWSVAHGGFFNSGMVAMSASLIVSGVVMAWVGLYLRGMDMSGVLAGGVPGTAQVQSVQDTGVTINNFNIVVKVGLLVTIPGAPTYAAETRCMLGRMSWGSIQPGMTVAVKVDPKNPLRVAIDLQSAPAGAVTMAAPSVTTMGAVDVQNIAQAIQAAIATAGPATIVTSGMPQLKAADIIRDGTHGEGTLVSVMPSGLTGGQVSAGLEPEQADDPMVILVFTYEDAGRVVTSQGLCRVPDGKAGFLATGAKVPVAYLPGRNIATVDWTRLA